MHLNEANTKHLYKDYYHNQAIHFGSKILNKKLKENFVQLNKEIIPLLPSDKNIKILDIGCGFGCLIFTLNHNGYKNVLGIDISEDQVKQAHQLGIKEVIQYEASAFLQENTNSFDVIIGIDLIEHYKKENLLNLLEKVNLSLKPNGYAIFRTPNIDAPLGSTYSFGDFTHQTFLNYASALQLFTIAGFEHVMVLPSFISVKGILNNFVRKIIWFNTLINMRLTLFASGKSSKNVIFTPNLIVKCKTNKR